MQEGTAKAEAVCNLCGVSVTYEGPKIEEVSASVMRFLQGNEDHEQSCSRYKPQCVSKRTSKIEPQICPCKACKFERGEGYEHFTDAELQQIEAAAKNWLPNMQNPTTAANALNQYAQIVPYLIHEIRQHRLHQAAEAILKGIS